MSDAQDQRSRHGPVPDGEARRRNRLDADSSPRSPSRSAAAKPACCCATNLRPSSRNSTPGCRTMPSARSSRRSRRFPPTIDGNREMLSWLRGERQWYDEEEKRHRPRPADRFREPGAQCFSCHLGMEAEAARPQGQPGRRHVLSSTASRSPSSSTRTPRTATPSSAGIKQLRRYEKETPELIGTPQLFNVTHLLDYWYGVTWNAIAPVHGAVEADAGRGLPVRGAGVLRADGFPAHAPALDFVLRRGRRDAKIGPAPAPAPRHRQDRRPLRGPDEETRSHLAHAGLGQDLHAADGGAADPRAKGALQERDRHPGRRPHRA